MKSSRRRKESSAEKVFAPTAADRLLQFCVKTIIPLIPLAAIFAASYLIINAEISGRYSGFSPSGGAVILDLQENNEVLSGSLLLGRRRYQIVEGKLPGDNQMELKLQKQSGESVLGLSSQKSFKFKSTNDSVPDGTQVPAAADNIEKNEFLTLRAEKDQNDLSGEIHSGDKIYKFTASRSAFTAFFGRRWINRCLNYVGIKLN